MSKDDYSGSEELGWGCLFLFVALLVSGIVLLVAILI